MNRSVLWFRRDVRLHDNPMWAAGHGSIATPLFVIDPRLFDDATPNRRLHLVAGLAELDRRLQDRGGRLRVERGDPVEVVPRVAAQVGADTVHVSEEVTPYGRRRDAAVGRRARLVSHPGTYTHPIGSISARSGGAYRVFGAFHYEWMTRPIPEPAFDPDLTITDVTGIGVPDGDMAGAGETGALVRLARFSERVDRYHEERDRPDLDTTSRLSIDLKFGWLGPATAVRETGFGTEGRTEWARQVAWRDFFANLLAEDPSMAIRTSNEALARIRWRESESDLDRWREGRTGYPLVDAGMRQLTHEGWIHNRVRMVVASFLVKHLLIDWRLGERHFRKHLLDADLGQNAGNWQWVAGTGRAASPWFRILNPVTQSRRFDPYGDYIRRWVPELDGLPSSVIHDPWEHPPLDLGGLTLGVDYPEPVVDHFMARERALTAYRAAGSR